MAPIELHTRVWHPESGPSKKRALLLHGELLSVISRAALRVLSGICGGSANWWRLAPHLAARAFTVLAPDLRGHGKSPRAGSYAYSDYIDDLPDGFDVVIGHSLGAMLAIDAAHQRGERFAHLIIPIDPFRLSGQAHVDCAQEMLSELDDTQVSITDQHPKWTEEDVRAKLQCAEQADRDMVIKTFEQNNPMDLMDAIKDLKVKTVVIAGEAGLWTAELEKEVASNSHVQTRRIPDTGHSVHRDDWRNFAKVLDEVLQ